jgi:chromosome segregation ATPase
MKIASLLNENQQTNTGTVKGLPVDKDLIYKARNKYPGYDSQQALTLYIADQMTSQEKTDSVQNNLIDTQKRENERLRNVVNDLGQELQDFEQQSIETDREVARLKQLSGMLTTGGVDTKQKAKVSADELEKLNKDLEELKTKPGMDPKVYNELNSQIKALKTNKSTEQADVNQLRSMVKDIENSASVNYNQVARDLKDARERLADKELRFKEYKSSFKDYKKSTSDKLEKFGKEMNNELEISRNLRAGIMQDAEDINKMKVEISQSLDFINQNIEKMTSSNSEPDKKVADISWLVNNQKQQNMPNPASIQESITEGYDVAPSRQYRNTKYNEWITKHLPGLFSLFTRKYGKDLEEKGYTNKQIADTLEDYVPMLYNLGDERTPLTPQQVQLWIDNVKLKLWEQPVQHELFNESLDKTYARMLDKIIGLPYI